jgi:hypothetical protein
MQQKTFETISSSSPFFALSNRTFFGQTKNWGDSPLDH